MPVPGDFQGQAGWGSEHLICYKCPCSLQGSWTRWPLKVPSNSKDFMILFYEIPVYVFRDTSKARLVEKSFVLLMDHLTYGEVTGDVRGYLLS